MVAGWLLESREETMIASDECQGLPQDVSEELDRLTASASKLTKGMILSLIVHVVFPFVFFTAIVRLVESRRLMMRLALLAEAANRSSKGPVEGERTLHLSGADFDRLLQFKRARVSFRTIVLSPFVLALMGALLSMCEA